MIKSLIHLIAVKIFAALKLIKSMKPEARFS